MSTGEGAEESSEQMEQLQEFLRVPWNQGARKVLLALFDSLGLQHGADIYQSIRECNTPSEPLLIRARIALISSAYGSKHPFTATETLSRVAYEKQVGDWSSALRDLEDIRQVFDRCFGSDHFYALHVKAELGMAYQRTGDFASAESTYKTALKGLRENVGPNNPAVSNVMNNLGNLYREQAKYDLALPMLKKALKMEKRRVGEKHPRVARILANLALLRYRMGEFTEADRLFRESLRVFEDAQGAVKADWVHSVIGVAMTKTELGDFASAESLLLKASERLEAAEDDQVSWGGDGGVSRTKLRVLLLFQLGYLYQAKNDLRKAKRYYEQARELAETDASRNPQMGLIYLRLGQVLLSRGEAEKGLKLVQKARNLFEEVLGAQHPFTAFCTLPEALGHLAAEDIESAMGVWKKAEKVMGETVGANTTPRAMILLSHAIGCRLVEDYAKARSLCTEARGIFELVLGRRHPTTIQASLSLSEIEFVANNSKHAFKLALQAAEAQASVRENAFFGASERQRLAFEQMTEPRLRDLFMTLASGSQEGLVDAVVPAARWLVRNKGIVMDSMLEDRRRLRRDPKAQDIYSRLKTVKATISGMLFESSTKLSRPELEHRRERLTELRKEVEELEMKLGRLAGRYREGRRASRVTLEQLREITGDGRVLIEFVRFRPIATSKQRVRKNINEFQFRLPAVYGVFVIGLAQDELVFTPLGSAEEIDRLINRYQKAMQNGKPVLGLAKKLYNKIWQPVKKKLRDKREVILSPAGRLNFLSFATLVGPKERYLAEKYRIGYVGSGRDLVRRIDKKVKGARLFGNPAFGEKEEVDTDYLSRKGSYRSALRGEDRSLLSQMQFSPLPGTEKEVKAISEQARKHKQQVSTWLEKKATEARLKSLRKPRLLHLATHGFYLPGVEVPDDEGPGAMQMVPTSGTRGGGEMATSNGTGPAMVENPMHRSGLALAGASKVGEDEDQEGEDGIVTAEEVGTLDLWGTELVALSACETGLGEVAGGEGVMGLRRAFVQAGARNLVLSLWSVDDEATAKLMEEFYRRYLESGDAVGAMMRTQREMIRESRKSGSEIHPSKWGAFVVSFQGKPPASKK